MSAYIIDAVRTPIGRYGGALSSIRTDDLAALPIGELMRRHPNFDWENLMMSFMAMPIRLAKTIGMLPVWPRFWRDCRQAFRGPRSTVFVPLAWMRWVWLPVRLKQAITVLQSLVALKA